MRCSKPHKKLWFWGFCFVLFCFVLLLDIFFIYISNVISFPGFLSKNPLSSFPTLLIKLPILSSWRWNYPTLGHRAFTGSRTSPSTDNRQGHPLLNMQLEPSVLPCVLFDWWFSPWELWLVDIVVLPMGLQTSSVPSVLSLTPPLRFCD